MGLFGIISRKVKSIISPSWVRGVSIFGTSSQVSAMDSVWLIGGVEDKAQTISSLPIVFTAMDGKTQLETMTQEQKEWAYVLKNPDTMVTGSQLWELTTMLYETDGIAFWVLFNELGSPIQNPLEIPSRIIAFGRNSISPVFDQRDPTRVISWTLTSGGLTHFLNTFQVVRFWKANPNSYRDGLSMVDKVGLTIKLDKGAKKTNANFFENGARPSGVIKQTERIGDDQARKFAEDFRNRYSSPDNAGKIPLIPKEFDFKQDEGVRDMDFEKLHRSNRDEFFAATRVPKHHLGVNDDLNYATAEISDRSYYLNVIQPIANTFQDIINSRLLLGTGMKIMFSFDNIPAIQIERLRVEEQRSKNLESMWRIANRMWRQGYSQNQINEYLSLGAPTLSPKWANDPHDPSELGAGNMPTISESSKAAKNTVSVDFTKALPVILKKKSIVESVADGDDEAMDKFCRSVESKSIGDIIPKFEKTMDAYFNRLEGSQVARIEAYFDGLPFQNKAVESGNIELTKADVESVLFPREGWDATLLADTQAHYIAAYAESIAVVREELGGFTSFVQTDIEAAARARVAQTKVVGINERLRKNIRASIYEAIDAGGGRSEILTAVKSQFNAAHSRTVAIARTETGIAMNTARYDAISAEVPKKLWVSAKDGNVRASHRVYSREGSKDQNYEYFSGLKYPQDHHCNEAGEVVNCRCVLVAGK